jgi:hypothetical protein
VQPGQYSLLFLQFTPDRQSVFLFPLNVDTQGAASPSRFVVSGKAAAEFKMSSDAEENGSGEDP